jgi:hypothetical protein
MHMLVTCIVGAVGCAFRHKNVHFVTGGSPEATGEARCGCSAIHPVRASSIWHFITMNSSKKIPLSALFGAVSLWFAPASLAQVTTSNLGNAYNGGYAVSNVAGGIRATGSFTTDAFSYTLDSVTIDISSLGGSIGFYAQIFSDNGGVPGSLLSGGSLVGPPNPSSLATYMPSAALAFSPNTTYWLVTGATAGDATINTTSNPAESGPWQLGNTAYSSIGGGAWGTGGSSVLFFSVTASASAIPEPSTYAAIAGATMLGFVIWRRRAGKGAAVVAA